MACDKILNWKWPKGVVDRHLYQHLHEYGREHIRSWHGKALEEHKTGQRTFDAFMSGWVAFNAWAACVTALDADAEYIDTLKRDPDLCARFEHHLSNTPEFAAAVADLRAFWPVYKAQEVRRKLPALRWTAQSREEAIEKYRQAGLTAFEPRCFDEHAAAGHQCPVDWPHALAVIYRVRCNLFHGEKSLAVATDVALVDASFRVLAGLVELEQLYL